MFNACSATYPKNPKTSLTFPDPGLPGGVGLVRGYHLPGIITTGSIAFAALTLGQAVP